MLGPDLYWKAVRRAKDEHFLRYRAMEELMKVVGVTGGYAFTQDVQEAYFYPNEMGNFQVRN